MKRSRTDLAIALGLLALCAGLGIVWATEHSSREWKPLSKGALLTVDGIALGMDYDEVKKTLQPHCAKYEEIADEEVLYLVGGKHFVVHYTPDTRGSDCEVVFTTDRLVEQVSGCTMAADGAIILAIGDSEKKASALFGRPDRCTAETANTTGDYWDSRDLALLIHSQWSSPRFLRTYTVSKVTLYMIPATIPGCR